MNSGPVARRYARSLLDKAEDAKAVEAVEEDVKGFLSLLSESDDLKELVKNPLFSKSQKQKAMAAIVKKAKCHDLTGRLLGVLIDNGRLGDVEAIFQAVETELSRRRGEVKVSVETADTLSQEQETKLRTALSKKLGADISLQLTVDKTLMGGMKVIIGSRLIDNSVKTKLEKLQIDMGGVGREAA